MQLTFPQSSDAYRFLNALRKHHVKLYRVTVDGQHISCEISWRDLRKVRKIRRQFQVKMELMQDFIRPVLQLNGRTVIGLLLLLAVPFCSQFYTWGFEVKGDTIERKVEVERLLEPISFPVRTSLLPSEHQLRQSLLLELQHVAWVHVEKDGGKLKITIEEAPKIKNETVETGSALIAQQGGVVTHYTIESGVKQFVLNEVVEEGDVLVSGEVIVAEETRTVPVRGKVFVDFWRTVSFTMSRQLNFTEQHELRWIVGLPAKDETIRRELVSWEWLPSWANIRQVSEQKPTTLLLDEGHLDSLILPLVQQKALEGLSEDATIRSEKLLHVTFDNDTVKGQVLYLVNENVAVLSSSD